MGSEKRDRRRIVFQPVPQFKSCCLDWEIQQPLINQDEGLSVICISAFARTNRATVVVQLQPRPNWSRMLIRRNMFNPTQ